MPWLMYGGQKIARGIDCLFFYHGMLRIKLRWSGSAATHFPPNHLIGPNAHFKIIVCVCVGGDMHVCAQVYVWKAEVNY